MESLMKYISRTHRCANSYRAARLGIEGLASCQHVYLFQICKNPGISQEQLARILCVNRSNVTRHLGAMEQNGFVRREPDSGDRRVLRVYPTGAGLEAFPRVRELMREWNDLLLEGFTVEERESLAAMLARVAGRAAELAGIEAAGKGGRKKSDE